MVWKAKEATLTQEQAIALARKELAPYWFGSEPLFAAMKTPERTVIVPLESEFSKKHWILFLVDPSELSANVSYGYAEEWYRRYHALGVGILMLFSSHYSFLKEASSISAIVEEHRFAFPCALDVDDLLLEGFGGVETYPRVILYLQSSPQFEVQFGRMEDPWSDFEKKIQTQLRLSDPGLSLFPVFQYGGIAGKAERALDLGSVVPSAHRTKLFSPGFEGLPPDPSRTRTFTPPASALTVSGMEEALVLKGTWTQERERLVTSDPGAELTFKPLSKRVSLIAQSLGKEVDPSLIAIEFKGSTIYDGIIAEDMVLTDSGASEVRIKKPRIYHLLTSLTEAEQQYEVIFRFPGASHSPVALYGLRMGSHPSGGSSE